MSGSIITSVEDLRHKARAFRTIARLVSDPEMARELVGRAEQLDRDADAMRPQEQQLVSTGKVIPFRQR